MPVPIIPARFDDSLRAVVHERFPLVYTDTADPSVGRPPFVRAASGAAWSDGHLVIVQDDTNFVAKFDPQTRELTSRTLPPGQDGRRIFEEGLGNKKWKMDLESCVTVPGEAGPTILAFGSGSTVERERVVVLSTANDLSVIHAATLYAAFRADVDFSGSELNIEGAVYLETERAIRFFQRGNGAAHGLLQPVNATCDVKLEDIWIALQGGRSLTPLHNVAQHNLGKLDGIKLTFTDAAVTPAGICYLAAAEDSPDTYYDGAVMGVVFGVLGNPNRQTVIVDPTGHRLVAKAEGLAFDQRDGSRAYAVIDTDNPALPSEMCVLSVTIPH